MSATLKNSVLKSFNTTKIFVFNTFARYNLKSSKSHKLFYIGARNARHYSKKKKISQNQNFPKSEKLLPIFIFDNTVCDMCLFHARQNNNNNNKICIYSIFDPVYPVR